MNIETDIKKIESKMIREYFEDGIVDIFLGMIFLWVIVFVMLIDIEDLLIDNLILILPVAFSSYLLEFFKKKLVYPRTGYSNQKKYGKRQVVQAILLMILGLTLVFSIVWILQVRTGPLYPFFSNNMSFIIAVVAAGYLALVAKISTVKRLYLYALATALIFIFAGFVTFDIGFYILYFSLILILSGAILLYRFLKSHPVLEVSDEEI